MWLESGGTMLLKDIAAALSISDSKVRKWKTLDKWTEELKGSAPLDSKGSAPSRGAPKGNKNAVGNKGGAPKGSKNALGNRGGHGGPYGNKKAIKTGEFESIWFDTLDEDEQELLDEIDTDPVRQADECITLLTIRERRMLQRIKRLTDGLTENQKRVLQQLKSIKEIIEVHDEKSGKTSKVPVTRNEMVEAEIEETTYRVIDDILKLEDALTRVQDKKLKAIELKNRLTAVDEEKEVRTAILQIELQNLQGGAGATQSWTEGLKEIAERRKAKRAEVPADE